MGKKIIITAAVVGSRPTKEMNAAVPYTPREIVEAAVECHKAGAAVVHVHVRDPKTGKPEAKTELFKEVLDGIREKCDMIVNLSTSGVEGSMVRRCSHRGLIYLFHPGMSMGIKTGRISGCHPIVRRIYGKELL